jgi:hypothetical protein
MSCYDNNNYPIMKSLSLECIHKKNIPLPASFINVGEEKEYVAYTIPNCTRIPGHWIEGEFIEVGPGKERLPNGQVDGELEADPCHIVCLGGASD